VNWKRFIPEPATRVNIPDDSEEAHQKCVIFDRALRKAERDHARAERMGSNVDRFVDNALAKARVAARQPEPMVANRRLYP
jgi:hypothetical protein